MNALIEWPIDARRPTHFMLAPRKHEADSLTRELLDREARAAAQEESNLLYVAAYFTQDSLGFLKLADVLELIPGDHQSMLPSSRRSVYSISSVPSSSWIENQSQPIWPADSTAVLYSWSIQLSPLTVYAVPDMLTIPSDCNRVWLT